MPRDKGKGPKRPRREEEAGRDVVILDADADAGEAVVVDEPDDDDPEFVAQRASGDMKMFASEEYRDKLVMDTVRLFLFMDAKKKPVGYPDIKKYVLSDRDTASGIAQRLVVLASAKIKELFGYDVRTAAPGTTGKGRIQAEPDEAPAQPQTQGQRLKMKDSNLSSSSKFVLALRKNVGSVPDLHVPKSVTNDFGIIFVILSYILMKEGSVSERDLFAYLRNLGIPSRRGVSHALYGDLTKDLLPKLIAHGYLAKKTVKESSSSEIKYMYEWGVRAEVEVDKAELVAMMMTIDKTVSLKALRLVAGLAPTTIANGEGEGEEEEGRREEGEGEGEGEGSGTQTREVVTRRVTRSRGK